MACPYELVPLDAFRRQLDVNVTGQLAVTQAMLPALRRARSRIVMVSTIGVRFSPPFAGPLDAAKAALTALGEALRQELAPWGIRVVLVEPATINSGAADKVTRDAAAREQGDQATHGGDGERGAERRGVEAQPGRQRRELDGPHADVKAEQAEQAGSEQVMGTTKTREQRTDSEGDRRN